MFHPIEEAIKDLKAGKLIIVCDDEDRENEGDFIGLAEFASPEMINFMAKVGGGLICTPITETLAQKLDLGPMVGKNTDHFGTAFTVSIDHKDTTTGVSAFERALTVQKMLDKNCTASDFKKPGHIFPLIAKEGGVLKRAGHTEAAIDLARLAGSQPAAVICEIMHEDGTMARVKDLREIAKTFNLKMITIKDLIEYRLQYETLVKTEVEIQLPTEFGDFTMIGFTNQVDGKEHIALVKGDIVENDPILTRVHSECLTGDVFGSCRCDCGPQLHAALAQINEAGKGILLYMRQEGRGIGLINKLKAYRLQEEGFDTVEANLQLGFEADMRDYGIAAQMLRQLDVNEVRLITNNPRKLGGLAKYGLEVVERVSNHITPKKENTFYLQTKKEKLGHLI